MCCLNFKKLILNISEKENLKIIIKKKKTLDFRFERFLKFLIFSMDSNNSRITSHPWRSTTLSARRSKLVLLWSHPTDPGSSICKLPPKQRKWL